MYYNICKMCIYIIIVLIEINIKLENIKCYKDK